MGASASLFRCVGARRRRHGHGEASERFLSGGTCAWCAARFRHATSAARRKMPTPRRWMRGMNRVFARSPSSCGRTPMAADAGVEADEGESHRIADHALSREQAAAAAIQACFRRHLARRAFRALRSLVKMQAFARGWYVRKQADVAIRCMNVLVRLQLRVRARQLLLEMSRDQ